MFVICLNLGPTYSNKRSILQWIIQFLGAGWYFVTADFEFSLCNFLSDTGLKPSDVAKKVYSCKLWYGFVHECQNHNWHFQSIFVKKLHEQLCKLLFTRTLNSQQFKIHSWWVLILFQKSYLKFLYYHKLTLETLWFTKLICMCAFSENIDIWLCPSTPHHPQPLHPSHPPSWENLILFIELTIHLTELNWFGCDQEMIENIIALQNLHLEILNWGFLILLNACMFKTQHILYFF